MLVFWCSAGLICYITVGYPALLYALASRYTKPVYKADANFRVSVVVPVHNGAKFLRRKLESILKLNYPSDLLRILVVSDGSTDDTNAIAREFATSGVQLLSLPRSGKAAALNAAAQHLNSEILVLTDVRQDLATDSVRLLLESFADPSVGVVSGELALRRGTTQSEADVDSYWRYESWIRNNLSRLDSMIGATGPFYAIRRKLFVPIPEDILLDDVYLPMTAFFKGYRLVMEHRAVAHDYPMSRDREFTRKVRTLGGNYQLLVRMPALLTPANRQLWHFLSYKVGRLLLPWLFIAMALAGFTLDRPWNLVVATSVLGFVSLALSDGAIPQRNILKKLSSPARTFVALMAATITGLKILFVPPRSLWKVTDIAGD